MNATVCKILEPRPRTDIIAALRRSKRINAAWRDHAETLQALLRNGKADEAKTLIDDLLLARREG